MKRQNDCSEELAELRARVRELEQELRMRDEFIIAAAHELRNPISPLVLHVQRLLGAARGAADDAISAKWLGDQLEVFSRRLARFMTALNRILDVSRMHSGRVELVLEEVDLCEVARDVAASFERELSAARSELTLNLARPALGRWDRMRLEQIAYNLVSNAIRYGDSGPISVAVRSDGARAVLTVKDHGIGIREQDQARIFERFERANSENRSGFGVGLWIVKQLCEAMGGSVSVRSSPSDGSTFTVTLPVNRDGSTE